MGREANVRRERTCPACKQMHYANGQELKAHSDCCQRAKDIGILLPGIARPQFVVKDLKGRKQ